MIRDARVEDVRAVVSLAHRRRLAYAAARPQFWRLAHDAVEQHTPFVRALIEDDSVEALVATGDREVLLGYLFASLVSAPPVYDPGGPSGYIDDYAVAAPGLWGTIGAGLLDEAKARLRARGAAQVVVVTGYHDRPKRQALIDAGLTVASEWFVGPLLG